MKDKNSNDGLPEVAEKFNIKKVYLFVLGVLVLISLGMYSHTKTMIKEEKPADETFRFDLPQLPSEEEAAKYQPKVEEKKPEITTEQIVLLQEKQKELQQRLSAPLMLVSNSITEKGAKQEDSIKSSDPNMQFMSQLSSKRTTGSIATPMAALNTTVAEGTLIHAVMESATNSDLPGFLRATVSESVYAEDGSKVLIPLGSRLIGQYKSGLLQGQSRIFVVWTRLITPNGITVNLGSPGVDNLGVSGIGADEINRHFWQRFGTVSLLSIIGAGAANIGVAEGDAQNSASSYREALANSFSQTANQSLQQDSSVAPTLQTYQGKPIMVFVSHDLYFANALQEISPTINVF